MKIRKVKTIKEYKSFADFEWQKFCQNKQGQELIFQNFTAIYGENNSGESSICGLFILRRYT